jgi:hypothetical protein
MAKMKKTYGIYGKVNDEVIRVYEHNQNTLYTCMKMP